MHVSWRVEEPALFGIQLGMWRISSAYGVEDAVEVM